MDPINILNGALLLAKLASELAIVSSEFEQLVAKARLEGRDISDEELNMLKMKRKAAVKAWLDDD